MSYHTSPAVRYERSSTAPMTMDAPSMPSMPSARGSSRGNVQSTWRRAMPTTWVGMSGYLAAGICLGLVLILALSLTRNASDASAAAAALPPPAANAVFDNVLHVQAQELGADCASLAAAKQGPSRLTVKMEVGVDGKVRSVAASGETPGLRSCVESHLRGWDFLPQASIATMILPVEVAAR